VAIKITRGLLLGISTVSIVHSSEEIRIFDEVILWFKRLDYVNVWLQATRVYSGLTYVRAGSSIFSRSGYFKVSANEICVIQDTSRQTDGRTQMSRRSSDEKSS